MSEPTTPAKSFQIVHRVALLLLFLMMAQPTFDNLTAIATGTMVMGEIRVDVTLSKMALHIVAMVVGWLGLYWFFKRQKRGAYLSIAAHLLGFTAVMTQTPEMLEIMPPAVIAVFFVVMFAAALGPILAFKDQYS